MNGLLLTVGLARAVAGAVLLLAGASKLVAGPDRFTRAILEYRLAGPGVAAVLARVVPPLEVGFGSLLVLGLLSRPSSIVALALLLVFTAAIVASLVRGLRHDCGCAATRSAKGRTVRWALVQRNLALAAALCASAALDGGRPALDAWLGDGPARLPAWPLAATISAGLWLATTIAVAALRARRRPSPHGPARPDAGGHVIRPHGGSAR
jgi:uncharacterized membrane protein YphA (DoxX/SURF4 family)